MSEHLKQNRIVPLELASQAGLWYNEAVQLWCLRNASTLLRQCVTNLRRYRRSVTMDSLSPHADNGNPTKRCSGPCGRTLPATTEFFHRHKSNKDGLQYRCIQCRSIAKPKYIPPEGYKHCSGCGRDLLATTEYFGGHKRHRDGLQATCKQCKRKKDKTHAATHREDRRHYRKEHAAEITAYHVQWRRDHREQQKQYEATYREEHREQTSSTHKSYCDAYYKTERGRAQMRVSSGNRRARKRNASGKYTLAELYEQYDRQHGKCYYCHIKLGKGRNTWVAEHVIPLSRGGSNSIDNIVIACPPCNLRKGDKLPHEWDKGGRLL